MKPMLLGVQGLVVMAVAGGALASEVGDWAIDVEMCTETRIVFTADGLHQSRMLQDGAWQTLASAPYRREGNLLIVDVQGTEDRLEVLEESTDRLVLRNADLERQQAVGIDRLELSRCPED